MGERTYSQTSGSSLSRDNNILPLTKGESREAAGGRSPQVFSPALLNRPIEHIAAFAERSAVGQVERARWSLKLQTGAGVHQQFPLFEQAGAIESLSGIQKHFRLNFDVGQVEQVEERQHCKPALEFRID